MSDDEAKKLVEEVRKLREAIERPRYYGYPPPPPYVILPQPTPWWQPPCPITWEVTSTGNTVTYTSP